MNDSKIILKDTRQQSNKMHHQEKDRWFMSHGYTIVRQTISCGGDYQMPRGKVGVDTKQSIQELIGDIQVKAMSQKEIKEKIAKLGFVGKNADDLFHIIVDDDSNRLVEAELTQWCFEHRCEEKQGKLNDLYVKRHGFFHRGLIRAKMQGIHLYILVETTYEDRVNNLQDLFRWANPRLRYTLPDKTKPKVWQNGRLVYQRKKQYPNAMTGQTLAKACITMQEKYGCTFLFCRVGQDTAKNILDILVRDE